MYKSALLKVLNSQDIVSASKLISFKNTTPWTKLLSTVTPIAEGVTTLLTEHDSVHLDDRAEMFINFFNNLSDDYKKIAVLWDDNVFDNSGKSFSNGINLFQDLKSPCDILWADNQERWNSYDVVKNAIIIAIDSALKGEKVFLFVEDLEYLLLSRESFIQKNFPYYAPMDECQRHYHDLTEDLNMNYPLDALCDIKFLMGISRNFSNGGSITVAARYNPHTKAKFKTNLELERIFKGWACTTICLNRNRESVKLPRGIFPAAGNLFLDINCSGSYFSFLVNKTDFEVFNTVKSECSHLHLSDAAYYARVATSLCENISGYKM